MIVHLLEFVVIFLAAGALVNAWLHSGGIFEEWREGISLWGAFVDDPPSRADWFRAHLAQLLTCRVCLTYHAAFWLLAIFYIPSFWRASPWCVIWQLPVYALAAARLSLLIGSLTASLPIENDPEND